MSKPLNDRERFCRLMQYQPIDRLPVLLLEPIEQPTLERWYREGLPDGADPVAYLGMSRLVRIPLSFDPIPPFSSTLLTEDEEYYVERSKMGATVRRRKDNPTMFYGHIDHPIKTRTDWNAYKRRLQPFSPGRRPDSWLETVAPSLQRSPEPVWLNPFPFFFRFGFYTMGMERFLTAFHDEPGLIHEMFSHWSEFMIASLRPVLGAIVPDVVTFNDDLAGKNGPLISPNTYREFWHPYQDPVVQLLREFDVSLICQWSSGQFECLLPDMIEHGLNCTWPLEDMAGMDAMKLRTRFGRELRMAGNIPKEAVIAGPEAIDWAIERLMPLIREGGFLPALDDVVSPDMPFAHFRYMIEKLKSIRMN